MTWNSWCSTFRRTVTYLCLEPGMDVSATTKNGNRLSLVAEILLCPFNPA
jgi:hypothetical protein